jgi:hypothetical protein
MLKLKLCPDGTYQSQFSIYVMRRIRRIVEDPGTSVDSYEYGGLSPMLLSWVASGDISPDSWSYAKVREIVMSAGVTSTINGHPVHKRSQTLGMDEGSNLVRDYTQCPLDPGPGHICVSTVVSAVDIEDAYTAMGPGDAWIL